MTKYGISRIYIYSECQERFQKSWRNSLTFNLSFACSSCSTAVLHAGDEVTVVCTNHHHSYSHVLNKNQYFCPEPLFLLFPLKLGRFAQIQTKIMITSFSASAECSYCCYSSKQIQFGIIFCWDFSRSWGSRERREVSVACSIVIHVMKLSLQHSLQAAPGSEACSSRLFVAMILESTNCSSYRLTLQCWPLDPATAALQEQGTT